MNKGYVVLQGGAEFSGEMAIPDRRAIELAGGKNAKIRIIPAAAAPDQNHDRAGLNGKLWFESLGAKNVSVLPLIDFPSAQDPMIARELEKADLIFLLGGFPTHLAQSLLNSRSEQVIKKAYEKGAVLSGSSAGAMVLCEQFFDPYAKKTIAGLNLVSNTMIIPHFDRSGLKWDKWLNNQLLSKSILGIDEQTAVINDGPNLSWQVYGKGRVSLISKGLKTTFGAGAFIPNPLTQS